MVEDDDDDDDDDDDTPTPWQAVGRRLRDRLKPNADRAAQAAEMARVFDEVRQILDRRPVLQRAAWAQFDVPHLVPQTRRSPTGGRPWKEEVAIAAVIVLAGFAVYRGLSVSSRRLAPGTAILGAAGIIAPFLAGLEQEPRTLNLIPAFAYSQYIDRRRRRLEEDQTGRETGELLFEEPPGAGAPGTFTHYVWYDPTLPGRIDGILAGFTVGLVRDHAALVRLSWVIRGRSRQEVLAELARLSQSAFDRWYIQLVKEHSPDPIGGGVTTPGSEEEGANEEHVDESVPIGNRW